MLRRRETAHSEGLVHPWASALGIDHMMLTLGVPAVSAQLPGFHLEASEDSPYPRHQPQSL